MITKTIWLSTIVVCLVCMGMPAPAAGQSSCSKTGTIAINSNVYIYQQNEWNSSQPQCATVSGTGFTLTTANFNLPTNGPPATYPSIFRGCHWGNCTASSPFPIPESNIASASTSVTITQPTGFNNDAAYDIWFNQTSTTPGQPNGTEVMIWINHEGAPQPFGSQTGTVTIDGATWAVWTGRQSSWNIVSYVRQPPVNSVTNLDLLPFFSDAVSRGSLQSSWWLIDVEYGFEVWTGGQGLGVTNFSVSAAAGHGGGASCAAVPSAPSGVTGTAASSSVINVSWTADVAPPNCTINSYNVFRSTTSGFTPSASNQIASGVTSTSFSDTGLTASTTYHYVVEAVDADGTSAPSAQATAQTSPASGGGGTACHVVYTISPQNSSAFGAAITIQNTGSMAFSNWTLTWTFANGQTIASLWNGAETQSGSKVTVNSLSYNGNIPAGGSYSGMGFNGAWNGTTNAVPTSFTVNGTTCN
ncbi:MAG TPA: cellulose binding domain-containing protein [Candidatus Angelobacter sp.]|nr:cellulose binding domain-containing protein [Candidatus Angelobacter sp.]